MHVYNIYIYIHMEVWTEMQPYINQTFSAHLVMLADAVWA